MTDLMKVIQDADIAALALEGARDLMEKSKAQWERTKEEFEVARQELDMIYVQADELGLPKAKIKKIIEERTSSLISMGFISSEEKKPKSPRANKSSKKASEKTEDDVTHASEPPEEKREGLSVAM